MGPSLVKYCKCSRVTICKLQNVPIGIDLYYNKFIEVIFFRYSMVRMVRNIVEEKILLNQIFLYKH